MRRSDVPTPALLVDIDNLDRNIAVMRNGAREMGVALRPHAKAHKCIEIAQRIAAAGAIGVSRRYDQRGRSHGIGRADGNSHHRTPEFH